MHGVIDVDRLTDRQKQCLRLVHERFETKDIARELGITPGRVNKIIGEAMIVLGVSRRAAAARLLIRHEASLDEKSEDRRVGGHSIPLPAPPISTSSEPAVEPSGSRRELSNDQETQRRFFGARHPSKSFPLPFPTDGRVRNDLTGMSMLTAVAVIAAASLCAAGAAVSLLFAFSHWVHG